MKALVKFGRRGFRWTRLGGVAAVSLCLVAGFAFAAETNDAQNPPHAVMPWVSDVVKMNDAGIAPDVIANYVRNTDARSTLSADDIIYLRDHGISTALITAMIQHGAVPPPAPTVPMPATPAPAPVYAQYPPAPAPDYSAYQPEPAVNYYYYNYPDYGYTAPYYWYWNYSYPYYPIWYYPFGFTPRGRHGFDFGRGRSFGRSGFVGGFRGSLGGFHGSIGGFRGGGVHSFGSAHFGGGMAGHGGRR